VLTLTAILVGLCLLKWATDVFEKKVSDGGDIAAVLVAVVLIGVVVWQFYFVMLPAAWPNGG